MLLVTMNCIFTIPIGMKVLFELVMHQPIQNFDVKSVSTKIFIIITIPTILGIITNRYFNYFKERVVLLFDKISMVLFLLIISIAVYQERMNLGGYFEYAPCTIPDGELLVNEEGLLLRLPVNEIASIYFCPRHQYVVGDVIIGTPKGIEYHMKDALEVFIEEEE